MKKRRKKTCETVPVKANCSGRSDCYTADCTQRYQYFVLTLIYSPPCMMEGDPLLIEVALQKGPLPPTLPFPLRSPPTRVPPPTLGGTPTPHVNPSSWVRIKKIFYPDQQSMFSLNQDATGPSDSPNIYCYPFYTFGGARYSCAHAILEFLSWKSAFVTELLWFCLKQKCVYFSALNSWMHEVYTLHLMFFYNDN
jgi:hypothetical protein